jgi:hypothetical protein
VEQLTRAEWLMGEGDLYRKWLCVCGHVENFDYEDFFTEPELMSADKQTSDDDLTQEFLALMGGSS